MKSRQTTLTTILLVLMVVLLAGAGYLIHRHFRPADDVPVAVVTPLPPDALAAMAGVQAFYTIDHAETENQWLERLCPLLATVQDCAVEKLLIAPQVYALAQQHQIQTTCSVLPVRLVMEKAGTDGSVLRVWELQVTFDNPWPGQPTSMPVYADVVMDPADQTWAMRHILFAQEVQALQTAMP